MRLSTCYASVATCWECEMSVIVCISPWITLVCPLKKHQTSTQWYIITNTHIGSWAETTEWHIYLVGRCVYVCVGGGVNHSSRLFLSVYQASIRRWGGESIIPLDSSYQCIKLLSNQRTFYSIIKASEPNSRKIKSQKLKSLKLQQWRTATEQANINGIKCFVRNSHVCMCVSV